MWESIEDILTPKGLKELKTGQVLIFNYEGSPIHLKIRRKSKGRVWAERINLYRPDEVEIIDRPAG
jgi:hypothetical protein